MDAAAKRAWEGPPNYRLVRYSLHILKRIACPVAPSPRHRESFRLRFRISSEGSRLGERSQLLSYFLFPVLAGAASPRPSR